MILKNINRLFLLFIFCFLISCQKIDFFNNNDDEELKVSYEEVDNSENLDNFINLNNKNYIDYFSSPTNFIWQNNVSLNKKIVLKNSTKKNIYSNPLNLIIYENKIYQLDFQSNLIVFNIEKDKIINKIKIIEDTVSEFDYPTSLAYYNNSIIAGYANGKILNFDLNGNILWQKNFNDILKTPLKIYNEKIIILFSDKIVSINIKNGESIWTFNYNNNNPLSAYGGSIIEKNHLLYFSLPNGRLGTIDTILGSKIDSNFSNIFLENNYNSSNNLIHSYRDYICVFEDNKYLTTINVNTEETISYKAIINNSFSHYFINNSLLSLNNNIKLRSYNIKNTKLFWEIDLSDYLKDNFSIVSVINNKNRLIIFFSNGMIFELDINTGFILNNYNTKFNDLFRVNYIENFIIFTNTKGKTILYKQ